jgi:hypothetical protein
MPEISDGPFACICALGRGNSGKNGSSKKQRSDVDKIAGSHLPSRIAKCLLV